jgi:hypothetical protein
MPDFVDAPRVTRPELDADLDALSLDQALLDVEIANARVADLTQRLLEAGEQIRALTGALDAERVAHGASVARLAEMESSQAYRMALKLRSARSALRR